jgi:hypothetical protein
MRTGHIIHDNNSLDKKSKCNYEVISKLIVNFWETNGKTTTPDEAWRLLRILYEILKERTK